MDITRRLASFAAELSYQDLPKDVVERTKRLILDVTGIIVRARHDAQSTQSLIAAVEKLGLATAPLEGSRLPRLADARVAFACSLYDIHYIGAGPQSLILGEVHGVFVDDCAIGEDAKGRRKILAQNINPIGRLGAGEYVSFGEVMTRERPD